MGDLSDLLMSSRALTSNLARPDLPTINFSLDQIEAQSRRLVARQAGASGDHGKG
jgi:nuclear pore complex protein Nup93